MSQIHVDVSDIIDASPEEIYAILSDYRGGHLSILPKPYFTGLTVEQGGQGAGTVAVAEMNVLGAKRTYRLVVTEPEPGRLMVETDEGAGVVTSFKIEPLEGGARSRVTISTDAKTSPGFAGFMERLLNPPITGRIYREELKQLADVARRRRAAGG
jgi:hypothetical protein